MEAAEAPAGDVPSRTRTAAGARKTPRAVPSPATSPTPSPTPSSAPSSALASALGDGPPRIRLEEVTVRYPGREEAALDRVSLVIEPGERVAIVGPSGAGKSTLLHLLLGFVTPAEGRVLVGENDLAGLDLDAWRRLLAFVPQRPHLFATSVAENIALGSAATPEEIRTAAAAAQVAEFADALPQGYDTPLGERGANLSAGQRQRVALARAFCRPDARLLLLDEPTARLDGRSEAAVVEATRTLARGRTAVIVAHRPAMIDLADRVIRLDGGALVPVGGVPVGGVPVGAPRENTHENIAREDTARAVRDLAERRGEAR